MSLKPNHSMEIRGTAPTSWDWLTKVKLRHYNTWPITVAHLWLCSHCSQVRLIFSRSWGKCFPAFRKETKHFLSQNNSSLWLTRLPAIFTQLKLQMIYFQLHYTPALMHMVLSITLVTEEQKRQGSGCYNSTKLLRKMERNKRGEGAEKSCGD